MLSRVTEFNLTHYPTHLIQEHDLNGQGIGYIRVRTFEQNPDRQLENVQVDRLFTDKLSGKGFPEASTRGHALLCARGKSTLTSRDWGGEAETGSRETPALRPVMRG